MNSSELIAVSTFRSTADAQIAKGVLDEEGIESMIRSDNAGGMYPALAGADLLVRSVDLERATKALTSAIASQPDNCPTSQGPKVVAIPASGLRTSSGVVD